MTATKIQGDEIASLRISSLPTRPTAPTSFGGAGYTATQMKEAFDKLPLFLVERFNRLIDDIGAQGTDSLSGALVTGIRVGHTLSDLFTDITDGDFASYLSLGDESVLSAYTRLCREMELVKTYLAGASAPLRFHVDCATPAERAQEIA